MKRRIALLTALCLILSLAGSGCRNAADNAAPEGAIIRQETANDNGELDLEALIGRYAQWLNTPYTFSHNEAIQVAYYREPFQLADGGYTLGISVSMTTDYFQTIIRALTDRAEANGNTVLSVSAERSASKQIADIEDLISAGCDVIAVCALDREAITPALKAVQDAGIYCISFDAAPAALTYTQGFVGTDNYAAGYEGGMQMRRDYPDGGKVAVLSGRANTASLQREQGFLAAIAGTNLEVIITLDTEGDQQKGLDHTTDILQAYGRDLVAIWGVNDQCIMGAYASCATAGADIGLYGVDGTPESRRYIHEGGIFKMTAGQSPVTIGVLLYAYIEALLSHQIDEYNSVNIEVIALTPDTVDAYVDTGWQ